MRKYLAALLAFLLLTAVSAQAEELTLVELQAREILEETGIVVTDEAFEAYAASSQEYYWALQQMMIPKALLPRLMAELLDPQASALQLLISIGVGEYDYDTDIWTPSSDQVYAFDAEVYNVEKMYTLYLQGIDHIVPEASFTEIEEDLSNCRWEGTSQGTRDVSFLCNGTPYRFTLANYSDWFDGEMLMHTNRVLEEAGCSGRLHLMSGGYDQMITLYYGREEAAMQLYALMAEVYGELPDGFGLE